MCVVVITLEYDLTCNVVFHFSAAYGQVPPPPPGYAGAYPGYYPQQGPYYGSTGSPQVVHIKEKKGSNIGEIALGKNCFVLLFFLFFYAVTSYDDG